MENLFIDPKLNFQLCFLKKSSKEHQFHPYTQNIDLSTRTLKKVSDRRSVYCSTVVTLIQIFFRCSFGDIKCFFVLAPLGWKFQLNCKFRSISWAVVSAFCLMKMNVVVQSETSILDPFLESFRGFWKRWSNWLADMPGLKVPTNK